MSGYGFTDPDAARAALRAALEYLADVDGYPRPDLDRLCDDEIRNLYEDVTAHE